MGSADHLLISPKLLVKNSGSCVQPSTTPPDLVASESLMNGVQKSALLVRMPR